MNIDRRTNREIAKRMLALFFKLKGPAFQKKYLKHNNDVENWLKSFEKTIANLDDSPLPLPCVSKAGTYKWHDAGHDGVCARCGVKA